MRRTSPFIFLNLNILGAVGRTPHLKKRVWILPGGVSWKLVKQATERGVPSYCISMYLPLVVAAAVISISTALEVTGPPALAAGQVFESATFAYFGNQMGGLIEGPAVVVDDDSLCYPEEVEGKIVVIGHWNKGACGPLKYGLGMLYDIMDKAGAVAVVYISQTFFPPGSMVYHYETLDRCHFCDRQAALLHVSLQALPDIETWRNEPALALRLAPTTRTATFRAMFDGLAWTMCFRCLLPIMAFATALEAVSELARLHCCSSSKRIPRLDPESRQLAIVVCAIEALSMALVGLALALGLWGPYSVPINVVNGCYSMLSGCGVFTTLVLGLNLREESLVFSIYAHKKRGIFEHYKLLLVATLLVTVVPDFIAVYLASKYYVNHQNPWLSASYGGLFVALQGVATTYFTYQAYYMWSPLSDYFKRSTASVASETRRKIGRLTLWLFASALCMAGSFLSTCAGYYLIVTVNEFRSGSSDARTIFFSYFFYALFRILVSTCQVHAIRPSGADSPPKFASRCFVKLLEFIWARAFSSKVSPEMVIYIESTSDALRLQPWLLHPVGSNDEIKVVAHDSKDESASLEAGGEVGSPPMAPSACVQDS